MNDLSRKIGWRLSSLALALALALGCSSQQKRDDAKDAGPQCGVIATVPLPASGPACAVAILLPPTANRDTLTLNDQSGVPIPHANSGEAGWEYGDPQAPILLTGSYCADATAGKITSVTFSVDCSAQPGGSGGADGGPATTTDASICEPVAVNLLSEAGDGALHACLFPLTGPLPLPTEIRVFADEAHTTQIPADSINGWTYSDAAEILLTGRFCDDALAGRIVFLYVISACPGHPIP